MISLSDTIKKHTNTKIRDKITCFLLPPPNPDVYLSEDFNYFIRNLRKFHQKLQTELEAAGINGAWDEIQYINNK